MISSPKPSAGLRLAACAMLLAGACALAGCSSMIADNLPAAAGGLPEGAPARATTQPAYPLVHEMPPTRTAAPLNEAEQKQLEADLIAARERAEGGNATGKSAASAKKK